MSEFLGLLRYFRRENKLYLLCVRSHILPPFHLQDVASRDSAQATCPHCQCTYQQFQKFRGIPQQRHHGVTVLCGVHRFVRGSEQYDSHPPNQDLKESS